MELIFIRHFPTKGNRLRQYVGRIDEDLDADFVKGFYKEEWMPMPETEYLIASPMKRCIQTAKLLYPEHEPVICEKMRECDFGMFEGKTYEELKNNPSYQKWIESEGKKPFPEGESRDTFQKRCVEGLQEMLTFLLEKKCKKAAFVVHGGTIMSVLSAFDKEKRDYYFWQVVNGDGYVVQIDENMWMQGKQYFSYIRKLRG